jgi:hypothetical protein
VILTAVMASPSANRTREMGPLTLRADFAPSTLDAEKRTVQLTWTTGARVKRGYWESYHEDLSLDPKHVRMDRLRSGAAPLLNSHSSWDLSDVIGVVESAHLEAGRGIATVRFARNPGGEAAFQMVTDGIVKNVSVGYRVHKLVKTEDARDREDKTPVYRAEDWEPYELSMVPIGADAGAGVRSANAITNPCEIIEERTMPDPVPENPTPTLTTTPAATPTTTTQPAGNGQRSAVDLERDRVLGIQRVGRALQRPEVEITAAINGGTTLEAFRAAAVDALAAAPPEAGGVIPIDKRDRRVQPGEDSRDKWLRGASAWLMQRATVDGLVAQDAKKRGQTIDLDPGEFRGLRMVELARQCLERAGVRTAGMLPMDIVGQALTQRSGLTGAASTGDFPVLLENTLNKVLLAAYGTTPDTWSMFCAVGSVSDFRPHKRYRLGSFSQLSTLNELGEFTNKAIPDGTKESITAATKGNIIGISRQALINDDLGAFSGLATALGRAARLSIEIDAYALLALAAGLGPVMNDGLTLFHATHLNVGTGAALGSAALDADRVVLASQKDPSGNEILDLRPAILVLPIGLGGQARIIINGQYDYDSTSKFQTPNRVNGLVQSIVDTPRMTGTRRYLFASPAISPVIEVAFLDGQQQPFMDIYQGWRVDGVEWKVRLDYAVGAIDFRGAVTNAGV